MKRHYRHQLAHSSFGYVVAKLVCTACGSRELGHVRRYADGTLHLLTPDPSDRPRRMLVDRKVLTGRRVEPMFVAVPVTDIPDTPETVLRCRVHGERLANTTDIVVKAKSGKPTRPAVLGI